MITGINLLETENYISKYDNVEPKTVWKIGAIDSEQMPIVMMEETKALITMTMAVRFGLRGFENFKDSKGNDVVYATEQKVFMGRLCTVLADSVLKIMPAMLIIELGQQILKIGQLSEGEAKN